jgi:biopolymer transport protein ExbB
MLMIRLLFCLLLSLVLPSLAAATPAAVGTEDPADLDELTRVDWVEEAGDGGYVVVVQLLGSVVMVAFAVERLVNLRASRFAPRELAGKAGELVRAGRWDELERLAKKQPSTLGRMALFLGEHRHAADRQALAAGVAEVGMRDVADQEQKNTPFSVIAALQPLLGLLGTMIGMIEAFKLVEVFGDEGGAAILAGSISKALITTALGLVLAMPAYILYFVFKGRVHGTAKRLEEAADGLTTAFFLAPPAAKEKSA